MSKIATTAALSALLLLGMSSNAKAGEDTYGPPAPSGYVEHAPTVSQLWTSFTDKVKTAYKKLTEGPQRQPASEPTAADATPIQLPSVANVDASNPEKVGALQLSKDQSRNQPREWFERNGGTEAPSVSNLLATMKQKKAAMTIKPLAGDGQLVAKRQKFESKLANPSEPKIDANALMQKSVLAAFIENKIIDVTLVPAELVELVWNVLQWRYTFMTKEEKRAPETAKSLVAFHELSKRAKNTLVRSKSTSFEGWILQEDLHTTVLGALRLVQALQLSPADEDSVAGDAAILTSIGRAAKDDRAAKDWLTPALIAKHIKSLDENGNEQLTYLNSGKGMAQMYLAESAFDAGSLDKARKFAQGVKKDSEWSEPARFLAAVSLVPKSGKGDNDKKQLESAGKELTELFRTVDDNKVFDATAVTLGRIHFLLGNYEAAHKYLTQVSRDSNLWIESAVDNAWALLRSGDKNHAVGNVFTLHTSYFDGAYIPESHFVQTLGYQELCQFGDALTSVKTYKMRYHAGIPKITEFNKGGKQKDSAYYDDLVAYLSRREHTLPEIVLREMGRHPEFLKRQGSMNAMSREQKLLNERVPAIASDLEAGFRNTIETKKSLYKSDIAHFLKARAVNVEEELKFLSANLALLEYEIFAGASQNLALQGAQNFAVAPDAAKRKEVADKEYWPYEDEIWEDELNHFRSKIVDGCAKVRTPAQEAEKKNAS